VKSWLRRHPIAGFVLLAYAISYLLGFPLLVASQAWARSMPQPLGTYLPRMLVVYGPGLAALILAAAGHDDWRAAVRGLPGMLRPRKADIPWAACVLVVAAIGSTGALVLSGVEPARLYQVAQQRFPLLLAHFGLQLFIVALGEELGWRGWLLPALLKNGVRLRAALIVGAVWTLWHVPLLLSSVTTTVMFIVGTVGLSVLFTWLWAHTGERLFAVVIAHAAVNTPVFFWEQAGLSPGEGSAQLLTVWYVLEAFYAAVALLLVAWQWRWWTLSRAPGVSEIGGGSRP
jgi:membrane protease YdiL (CAAX protease family)